MKIALIKIQNYYDLEFQDAITNFDKNKSIKIDYSNINTLEVINKKNKSYYDNFFPEIVKLLNKKHNINYSDEFWQLLIGPWLYKAIEFFHDKYYILKKIPNNIKIEFQRTYFRNHSFDEIYDLYINEEFVKHSIYSLNNSLGLNKKKIFVKNYNYENNIKLDQKTFHKNLAVYKNILKKKIRDLLNFFLLKKKYKKKILNINLPLNTSELTNISDKYNNLYDIFVNLVKVNNNPTKKKLVEIKIQKDFKNEFLNSLKVIINDWIPVEYNSEFFSNINYYKKYVKNINPEIILVRGPHETDIKIRFLIALFKEYRKSKVISFQEGGIGKYQYQKNYEEIFLIGTDYFFKWSKFNSKKKVINFYLTKTSWIKNFKILENDKILIVLGSFRKIFFSYYEGHLPDYSYVQLDIIEKLLNGNNILERSTVRFHNDYKFNERKYLYGKFKKLNISTREQYNKFDYLLSEFSLKIFLSDYTANMQSMIINHPTIIIVDKKKLIHNKIYSKVYNELYKNNILFYSPIKLINFINKNLSSYKKIMNWWYSKDVQQAKDLYISSLCATTLRIDKKLLKEINKIK